MTRKLSPLAKTALVTGIATVLGLISTMVLPLFFDLPETLPPYAPSAEFVYLSIQIKVFISTFILVILFALTWSYITLYRELPNKYTLSLVVLSLVLIPYAITSNPLLPLLLGIFPLGQLGPFTFLPDIFVGLATIVLFYQSQT